MTPVYAAMHRRPVQPDRRTGINQHTAYTHMAPARRQMQRRTAISFLGVQRCTSLDKQPTYVNETTVSSPVERSRAIVAS